MPDINACFISYRHPGDPGADKFVLRFKEVLTTQLALLMPNPKVFLDRERLGVGDFFNPLMANELCRSACMVIFYSPCHFETSHPYCGLEYHAMLDLEEERLQGVADLRNQGLIFPVALRGANHLPKEIRDKRLCLDLDQLIICESDFSKRKCQAAIKELAGRIFNRYLDLNNGGVFTNRNCNQFQFREPASIDAWLKSVSPINRFPGH